MTKRQPEYIRTFTSEDAAWKCMRAKNRANRISSWSWVVVDGPEDGEWTVMDLRSAIDGGFTYQWAA